MKEKPTAWWLIGAGVLFGLFLLNVFLGKAALLWDFDLFIEISDVGEFLVLFVAVIFFMIEVLRRESLETAVKTQSTEEEE